MILPISTQDQPHRWDAEKPSTARDSQNVDEDDQVDNSAMPIVSASLEDCHICFANSCRFFLLVF